MLVELPEVGVQMVAVPVQRVVLHLKIITRKVARRIPAPATTILLERIAQIQVFIYR